MCRTTLSTLVQSGDSPRARVSYFSVSERLDGAGPGRGRYGRIRLVGEVRPEAREGGPERSRVLQDLWRRTLAQVPTTFGRIAYLAALRDANTGRYQHFGLAQIYSAEEADQALGVSHAEAFAEWLNYPLAQQKSDLEEYLGSLEEDRGTVLRAWMALSPYRNLIPAEATPAQRELFVSDLELILELMRSEPSPSVPSRGA